MGCGSCTKSGGCEENKAPQRTLLETTLARLYPSSTWGALDDEARFRAGIGREEARRLARSLSAAAQAPAYHRAGAPDDLCDFIYLLCLGREPALVDVRDGLAEPEATSVRERYLRIAVSSVARIATLQEVAMELDGDEEAWVHRELPRPGVFDAKLLKRMQKVVDLLQASDVVHLDFGLLDRPAAGMSGGEYAARYGVEPAVVNFLFYAQPARTSSVRLRSVGDGLAFGEQGDAGVEPERDPAAQHG